MIVEVYYNLHKKCLSVRHRGKVVLHTPAITLFSATFVVREGGRQRVLEEGKKNVHAFVKGSILFEPVELELSRNATYNPYKFSTFVDRDTFEALDEVPLVRINGRSIRYAP